MFFSKTEEYTVKKGKIRDNALKAQLRTPMFKMQQQTPKKGKGSYSRKGKSDGRGYRQAA
nr:MULTISPECIES: alternative ribosome rescue factor ArfA [Halomonas]